MVSEVSLEMVLRTTVGSAFITVLPSASRISETMYGSISCPPLTTDGNRPHQLQGGDLEGLAERTGGQGRRPPFVRVRDQCFVEEDALALSPRRSMPVFSSTPKFLTYS